MPSPVFHIYNRQPPIIIARSQRPVGQGGFHTASLTAPDDLVMVEWEPGVGLHVCNRPTLSWVYDCGSENKPRVEAEVDQYLNGGRPKLDFLFVSHFDNDHINGIPALLDKTRGAYVDTVVLPYVNAVERLFAFARVRASGLATSTPGATFFREMIVDPATALAPFRPSRILFIRSGEAPDDDPDFTFGSDPDEGRRWKVVGPRGGHPSGRKLPTVPGVPSQAIVQDTATIDVAFAGPAYGWTFKPYVRHVSPAVITKFEAACLKRLGWTGAPFSTHIAKPGALAALVNNAAMASKMAAAYVDAVGTKGASNKNRTSMCVYAGPDPAASYWPVSTGAYPLAIGGPVGCLEDLDPLEIGWLGTGDAELKRNKWSKPFLAHYRAEIGRTFTILVPHHGSEHNFSSRLLDLEPRYGVASAWPSNPAWLHPHDDVRKAIETLPAVFKHVTETDEFAEQFFVFL